MEQMAQYYWSMLGARRSAAAAASATNLRSWPPPAHHGSGGGGEPSWEELAFARDAAGHLGGCVWPPRSYTCTFCRREFRSAQALGGHMNVHRRDRARLRECASPDQDHDVVVHLQDAAHKQHHQSFTDDIAPAPADHGQLLQLQESATTLFRAKAVFISADSRSTAVAVTTTSPPPSYISTIIKESKKNKLVISSSIPAAAALAGSKQALAVDEEVVAVAERMRKRKRADQQPEAPPPPFFLRPQLASSKGGDEHEAKVPKVVITSPRSPNSLQYLAGRQEVDLELRLGISPINKVV